MVGFDNQEFVAENLNPALTTVALPHYEMGVWATENLIDAIEGKTDLELFAAHPTVLECPLVVRTRSRHSRLTPPGGPVNDVLPMPRTNMTHAFPARGCPGHTTSTDHLVRTPEPSMGAQSVPA